ncbi:MAG: hypothetical protein EOS22_04765 [Mesorhizobium sp.]|uniref:hypothetical protein n=1 Tax=Mesorhizobium sp. TaxID=1871066 RepID=UPI000FE5FC93|nr:hypothetical protein [Mesorhizobium sp.]RWD31336.1 MAG: hypothetical protein EOS22_04765 [Mesorhizobium sp.]TJW70750.1 MAG: hypothetical protein E5V29_03300 [Mesorhizobium sp.]
MSNLIGKKASRELEAWTDASISAATAKGYNPTEFRKMRQRYGTLEAMRLLVTSGDIQTGFKRMQEVGLLDYSLEAGVLRFADEFGVFKRELKQAAAWRLRLLEEAPDVEPNRHSYNR